MTLGEKIRRILHEQKRSQYWLAKAAGLSENTISNVVCGHSEPSYRRAMRMARALGEDADWLLDDDKGWDQRPADF